MKILYIQGRIERPKILYREKDLPDCSTSSGYNAGGFD